MKFSLYVLEMFGEQMNVNSVDEALALIRPQTMEGSEVAVVTFSSLKALRKLLACAATYANEEMAPTDREVAGWIDEIGYGPIFDLIGSSVGMEPAQDSPEEEAKKKPKDRLKASQ